MQRHDLVMVPVPIPVRVFQILRETYTEEGFRLWVKEYWAADEARRQKMIRIVEMI